MSMFSLKRTIHLMRRVKDHRKKKKKRRKKRKKRRKRMIPGSIMLLI